jgi:hypothetical protein
MWRAEEAHWGPAGISRPHGAHTAAWGRMHRGFPLGPLGLGTTPDRIWIGSQAWDRGHGAAHGAPGMCRLTRSD